MSARDPIATWPLPVSGAGRQPNEVDLKRICRLLEKRGRYHYVSPAVKAIDGGYLIVSPCCSRNIDQQGGPIDIARIEFDDRLETWTLYGKDHVLNTWCMQIRASRLDHVMAYLNEDPERTFWQ